MAALEFVRTYPDDLLVISKDNLYDYLEKLRMVFIKLKEAWLKINADKSKLCALETEYLGCSHQIMNINSDKKGTSNSCNKTSNICQRIVTIPWHVTILPRYM